MKSRRFAAGYTLVELIVSLGVFGIVVTLAAGSYFIVLSANRYAQATSTSIDNFSFVLEKMTRSIRTGYNYEVTGDTFTFIDSAGVAVEYDRTVDAGGRGYITERKSGVLTTVTDPAIDVDSLNFALVGANASDDNTQPRVTITIAGTISAGPGTTIPFRVQTGATMRGIDGNDL